MACLTLKAKEKYFKNVRITCIMKDGAENDIRVDRAIHKAITEFEKGTHIKEDAALRQGREIEGAEP